MNVIYLKKFALLLVGILAIVAVLEVVGFALWQEEESIPQLPDKDDESQKQPSAIFLDRDDWRLGEMHNLQLALQLYHHDFGDYPLHISNLPKYESTPPHYVFPLSSYHYVRCSKESYHLGAHCHDIVNKFDGPK